MTFNRPRMAQTRPRPSDINLESAPQMLEYEAAADRIAADGPATVLDWGCGWGHMTRLLTDRGMKVTAFDYHADADGLEHRDLERFPGLTMTVSNDPLTLPYESGTFDAVLSMGVLEHVMDPGASLDEIHRVLVPGGMFYCYKLPNRRSYLEAIARRAGMYHHGVAEHDRLYDVPSAVGLVRAHDFDVLEAGLANMLPLGVPGRFAERMSVPIFRAGNGLARVPGLRQLATNVELIARARAPRSA